MKITARRVKKYLLSKGWTREIDFKNKELMIFKKQFPSDEIKVSLPSTESEHFYLKFSQIIGTISYFEEISIDNLINEIKKIK